MMTMVPHTEIILYEDDTSEVTSKSIQYKQDTEMPGVDSIFQSARSRYFQGSGRSRSPFTAQGDNMISPSELAILDCLINGGKVLSLKAHFILQLPDISPLIKTLFPREILEIKQLEVLKLRNNPLRDLPLDISRLKNLRVLVRLIDMAALVMHDMGLHKHPEKFPESVNDVLSSCTTCDCCHGVLYGPGLRIIRPVSKIHGIKNLPFLFRACSPNCLYVFKTSKETLSEILYGTSEP
ncbi:hypothetical protein KUTeg_011982 [Tegillarca granosa]|uniref:Leucine-rich repeat-containing protein 58 n=1 Tax=Tegillarca granosa TaxID=220873 RepID=A0ABQ9EY79_TEGGR|nr:hypothetical protein KUTeg_011982 [Tegillarca granosa]